MALLYAMLCSWFVVLRKLASRKHNRLKKNYEKSDKAFRRAERDCKNEEVAVGRPAALSAQVKLIKLYEELDQAKKAWVASKRTLDRRQKTVEKLHDLKGRKLPYTFGLVDMALVLKSFDVFREAQQWDLSFVMNLLDSFI